MRPWLFLKLRLSSCCEGSSLCERLRDFGVAFAPGCGHPSALGSFGATARGPQVVRRPTNSQCPLQHTFCLRAPGAPVGSRLLL